MSRLKLRHAALALAAVVLAAAVYVVANLRPAAPLASPEKLSIASGRLPHTALLQIAAAKGYFTDEGLELTIVPVTHGKAAIELLLQGGADLATAAEGPFVLQVLAGQPLGVAASMLNSATTNMIVARRDRGIASPRDLAGKRIGVTFGASGEYFLWAFLIRQKMAPGSVTLVDLLPGQIARALADGTIDAAATWQPVASDALAALGANGASFTEPNVYTETHVLIGRSELLRQRHAAVEKVVRALLRAEQFVAARPDEAFELIAAWLKVDAQTLRPIWRNFEFKVDLLQSQLVTLEDQVRWAMARGYAPQGPLPNLLPHLYLDALLRVRPERVSVVR